MSSDPWADYWAKGGEKGRSGCLPEAGAIDAVLDRLWGELARSLPAGAALLDLATGDGAVLKKLQRANPRLKLTGVDSAPALPPAPHGIRLCAGVDMHALPFPDARFDAVTSQFGIEYGDSARVAAETARVLKAGSGFAFVLHHRESAVVAHNLGRAVALRWAAIDSGLIDKARRLAQARTSVPLPTPAAFRAAINEAHRLHPMQPVAAEIATAVLQTLEMGRTRPPAESLEILATLAQRARDELGRLDALEAAACDSDRIEAILGELAKHGFHVAPPAMLAEPGTDRPFAWHLRGTARA